MLAQESLVAFAATTNAKRAAAFYGKVLGLAMRSEDDVAIVFDANGVELRIQKVEEHRPHPFTSLGWQVADVASVVKHLAAAKVTLERYPWMDQDAGGIWQAPSGARIAWFKDPDGNLL